MKTIKTRDGKELVVPVVHLNGTDKGDLLRHLDQTYRAITDVFRALEGAAPHGRDYYPQGPEAFEVARAQHEARAKKLIEVMDEIALLAHEVSEQ